MAAPLFGSLGVWIAKVHTHSTGPRRVQSPDRRRESQREREALYVSSRSRPPHAPVSRAVCASVGAPPPRIRRRGQRRRSSAGCKGSGLILSFRAGSRRDTVHVKPYRRVRPTSRRIIRFRRSSVISGWSPRFDSSLTLIKPLYIPCRLKYNMGWSHWSFEVPHLARASSRPRCRRRSGSATHGEGGCPTVSPLVILLVPRRASDGDAAARFGPLSPRRLGASCRARACGGAPC